jgi:hypothetical protein
MDLQQEDVPFCRPFAGAASLGAEDQALDLGAPPNTGPE